MILLQKLCKEIESTTLLYNKISRLAVANRDIRFERKFAITGEEPQLHLQFVQGFQASLLSSPLELQL